MTLERAQSAFRYGVATISRLLKLQVSFAKEPYKRDDILQKRPIIFRSLLIVATPCFRHISKCFEISISISKHSWDDILQQRPVILRSLLIVAAPYWRLLSECFEISISISQHSVSLSQSTLSNLSTLGRWIQIWLLSCSVCLKCSECLEIERWVLADLTTYWIFECRVWNFKALFEHTEQMNADLVVCDWRIAHCNTLQHTATHCNTLQHTATCWTLHSEHPKHTSINGLESRTSQKVSCTLISHSTFSSTPIFENFYLSGSAFCRVCIEQSAGNLITVQLTLEK